MTIKRIDIFEYTTSNTIGAVLLGQRLPILAPVRAIQCIEYKFEIFCIHIAIAARRNLAIFTLFKASSGVYIFVISNELFCFRKPNINHVYDFKVCQWYH